MTTDLAFLRLTGILLLSGAVLFWIGAFWPPYKQWTTSDVKEYLSIIHTHKINWYIIHGFFIAGILITLFAVQLFSQSLQSAGAGKIYSSTGSTAFLFGSSFWIINIAFRLSVTIWAAGQLAEKNILPDSFQTWMNWSNLLFAIYMILAYTGTGFLGLALKETSLLPMWVSWLCIVFGFVAVPGYLVRFPFFAPPLMVYLPLIITAVMILLKTKAG